jgi:hypothetical protein
VGAGGRVHRLRGQGYLTLPFMPLVIARLTGIRTAEQYRVFLPIALAVGTMAAGVEASIAALGDIASPVTTVTVAVAVGVAAYGIALYVVARPVLQLGLSLVGQLHPSQEAV